MATYTTWDPANKAADITLSGGNLTATVSPEGYASIRSVLGVSSGKYYWEITFDDEGPAYDIEQIGVGDSAIGEGPNGFDWTLGYFATGYAYKENGQKQNNNSDVAFGSMYHAGDVVSVALDMDAGKVWWALNGVWQASGNPEAGTNEAYSGISGTIYAWITLHDNTAAMTANFGASAFSHSVPSGFMSGLGIKYDIAATNPFMQVAGLTGMNADLSTPMPQAQGYTGIYSAPSIPMVQSEGFTGIHAEPSISMPTVILTGSDDMVHIESIVTIPSATAAITEAEKITGAVTIPSMEAAITERETTLADVSIPMMIAELDSGIHAELEATAPMMTAEGLFSGQCEATVPMAAVELEGKVGRVGNIDVSVPMISVDATGKTEHLGDIEVSAPMTRVLADLMTGKIIAGTATIPMSTIALSSYEDIDGDIDVSIPMVEPYIVGTPDRFATCTPLRYVEPV